METPRNLRSRPRIPTPRLSERKKSLFESSPQKLTLDEELDGIQPLDNKPSLSASNENKTLRVLLKKDSKVVSMLNDLEPLKDLDEMFDNMEKSSSLTKSKLQQITSELPRRSPRNSRFGSFNPSNSKTRIDKENIPVTPTTNPLSTCTDELPTLFSNSMNLMTVQNKLSEEEIVPDSSDDETNTKTAKKRPIKSAQNAVDNSQAKIRKLDINLNDESTVIPTKCFYSSKPASTPSCHKPSISPLSQSRSKSATTSPTRTYSYKSNRRSLQCINKGVKHNIRRKPKPKPTQKKQSIDDILKTIRNEKLKLLPSKRLHNDKVEEIHKIFRTIKNPIEMARPLSVASGSCSDIPAEFSDFESESESASEQEVVMQQEDGHGKDTDRSSPILNNNKKFFRSGGSNVRKEVKITDNIKATMFNGKLSIQKGETKKRKKIKVKKILANEFSSEQATVDDIIRNLDTSLISQEKTTVSAEKPDVPSRAESESRASVTSNDPSDSFDEVIDFLPTEDYSDFRNRLPYNTTDPETIEQQHLLLDFLISNKICNETNFQIFISDPDNHKEEASKIVESVMSMTVEHKPEEKYKEFLDRIPYKTSDPNEIVQQKNLLEFLINNDICTEENFQIFIADYDNRKEEAERIVNNMVAIANGYPIEEEEGHKEMEDTVQMDVEPFAETQPDSGQEKLFPIFYPGRCQPIIQQTTRKSRSFRGGYGANQYQIDAGQKDFGAKHCKQCGLVYTAHEPEEEKLHDEYHNSLHILKFKGWIDEDVVAHFPEWGVDGRIIRLSDRAHAKHKERLMDVLKVVDKELGFASYIFPSTFIAFLAIRKAQIVGLSLVQPLEKAHKYLCLNGVDCCTEDSFDAKCGISRIWVSPLHRRFHIATKLIHAVQSFTIAGEEISLDKIAFSAPTEDGKRFAKKVTKNENFLVYQ